MEKMVIVGAGGLGREVQWLIERVNGNKKYWEIAGYIDDGISEGTEIGGYKVLGDTEYLSSVDHKLAVVCAIGNAYVRKEVISRIIHNRQLSFPNLIDPKVEYHFETKMGKGNVICVGTSMTVGVKMEDFNIINPRCTLGHDVSLESFVTIYPGANISGNVRLKSCCELGTGAQVIQGLTIGESTFVGAGAVVVRSLPEKCTAVGIPAVPIKFHE